MSDNFYAHLRNKLKIEKLLKHPSIITSVFDADDTAVLEARKPLAAERKAIMAGKYAKAEIEANKKLAAATVKRLVAKLALEDAVRDENLAFSAAHATSHTSASELVKIEQNLLESADPRAYYFYSYVDVLFDEIRQSFRTDVIGRSTLFDPGDKYRDNIAQMKAAMEVLTAAKADVQELRFAAISRAALTSRLKDWCTKLELVLEPFSLKPPIVEDDDVNPAQSLWPAPQASGRVVGITLQ